MMRVIVRTSDSGAACNVGGPVHTSIRTFDVELPEVEAAMRDVGTYTFNEVIGVELLPLPGVTENTEAVEDIVF